MKTNNIWNHHLECTSISWADRKPATLDSETTDLGAFSGCQSASKRSHFRPFHWDDLLKWSIFDGSKTTRWAPTSYKWSDNPYQWTYFTLITGRCPAFFNVNFAEPSQLFSYVHGQTPGFRTEGCSIHPWAKRVWGESFQRMFQERPKKKIRTFFLDFYGCLPSRSCFFTTVLFFGKKLGDFCLVHSLFETWRIAKWRVTATQKKALCFSNWMSDYSNVGDLLSQKGITWGGSKNIKQTISMTNSPLFLRFSIQFYTEIIINLNPAMIFHTFLPANRKIPLQPPRLSRLRRCFPKPPRCMDGARGLESRVEKCHGILLKKNHTLGFC